MKIGLIVIGAIRISPSEILEHLAKAKESLLFDDNGIENEVTTIFCTWEPINKTHIKFGVNYYYDYNKTELTETLQNHTDVLIYMDNLDLSVIPEVKNHVPPLFAYQLSYIQHFIQQQNMVFDYIVKYRNDLKVEFYDIKKYFNTKTYITPSYWLNERYLNPWSDHFFIIPFHKFMSIPLSLDYIQNLTYISDSNERMNETLITPDIVIQPSEIRAYKVRDRVFQ